MILNVDATKPKDVVAFGRATIDLYANEMGPMEDAVTFTKYVGGSPANTAVAMANLGLSVGYVGKVSDDAFGRYIVHYLAEKGVETSHIETASPGIRSGVTMGEIRSPQECSYFMYRTNCADLQISCSQLDEAYISQFKLLLVSGTSLSHSPAREAVFLAIEYARRNGVLVALDLDYRDDTWDCADQASVYYTAIAEKVDMVLGTRDEFNIMEHLYLPGNDSDEISARRLLNRGVSLVSIKKGRQGSLIYTPEKTYRGGIYPAKVLKTFGAGDAYSGAFIFGLLRGKSIPQSLQYAAAASAITISGHSCSDSTPNLSELQEYMETYTMEHE